MGTNVNTEYCSFTKAVEHLGDRWSLLILRELAQGGAQGFNELAASVPGHISRSVLTDRLLRLADLGVVSRDQESGRQHPYRLTGTGEALIPTLVALRSWAEDWLPDDPAFVERDPDIVLGWLADRVATDRLPERQTVVELRMRHADERRSWLVLEAGAEPYGCLEDPLLDESRYVYLEAGLPVLMSLARGRRDLSEALADGSARVFGDPGATRQLATWFVPAGSDASPATR
jgi:DNA-binding HxlR family transcriptional regulator